MDWLISVLGSAAIGVAVAGVVVIILIRMMPNACPRCRAPFPKLPWQFKRRGWKHKKRGGQRLSVCGQCGCEMTIKGEEVPPPPV